MALQTTTNPNDFQFRRQEYLARIAWPELEYNLRMAQFFETETVPARGLKAARFYRWRKARQATGTAGPRQLTEGGQAARNSEVAAGYVDCYASQRGDDFSLSDISVATDILDRLKANMSVIMKDAALNFDGILMAAILGDATTLPKANALGLGNTQTTLFNSNNNYGIAQANYFERFAAVPNTGNSAADFATLAGLTASKAQFTRLENLRAMTQLRLNDVMPPDGKAFPAVLSPAMIYDMRQDATLVQSMTNRKADGGKDARLYKWESFELDGAAFIETTVPWIEAAGGYGIYNAAGAINTILYMGKDVGGMIELSDKRAGGSQAKLKWEILDKADKSDIYNQTIVGAWKAFFGAILKITSETSDVPHCCALRCKTTFA